MGKRTSFRDGWRTTDPEDDEDQEVILLKPVKFAVREIVVVLDINGLLMERKYCKSQSEQQALVKKAKGEIGPYPCGESFVAYMRPGAREFIEYLFANFKVAVWSSARYMNIMMMLRILLSVEQQESLVGLLSQTQCTEIGMHPDNPRKPLFIKELKHIWKLYGNPWNTLLIDDSETKSRLNPPYTGIHPKSWTSKKKHDITLTEHGNLYRYVKRLKESSLDETRFLDVPTYVRENPYED